MCFLRMADLDYKVEVLDPALIALVKVAGGKLTVEVVQTELAKLTRADWTWEALPHGEDSFLVAYPSNEELKRMAGIDFDLKNYGVKYHTNNVYHEGKDVFLKKREGRHPNKNSRRRVYM